MKEKPSAAASVPSDSEDRRLPASRRDPAARRASVARFLSRHRLEDFHQVLQLLAVAVFGPNATVVPHLRRAGGSERLTFVVDAADPSATVRYEEFLPRE